MNYVLVKFWNDTSESLGKKDYCYFTDLELSKGDICVVEVSERFTCVFVTETSGIPKADRDRAHKWIVQKVDVDGYEHTKKKGQLIMDIRQKLHERKEEAEEFAIYQQLASIDPEIKNLLQQLSAIDPALVPQLPAASKGKKGKK